MCELNSNAVFQPLKRRFSNLNGQFYAEIGKTEPHALMPWLAVPEALSGRIAARAW
jgi:hypothetical protein